MIKKFNLILIMLILCLTLSGCYSSSSTTDATTVSQEAMIIMPDGSLIKGICTQFVRCGGNWVVATIDGIAYSCNEWRIVRWQ